MAQALILLGEYDEAEKYLAQAETRDAFDWRVLWLRGESFLNQKKWVDAQATFENCYAEMPGDLAPKLAAAMAAEMDGQIERATYLYNVVSVTDPSFASASFGLARCLAKVGKRTEAVAALARIPQTSSLFTEAQRTTALTLINVGNGAAPGEAELSQAAQVIESIALAGVAGVSLVIDLYDTAVTLVGSKKVAGSSSVQLLGQPLLEHNLRLGLEKAYRDMAKLENDPAKKIGLVDKANEVRPYTTA